MEPKTTVLVVDDDADNRRVLTKMLQLSGYAVLSARSGVEALRLAAQVAPQLILMDLSMPEVDGWMATEQLKADPALAHIPIIAVTAHAMREDAERAFAAGCDDYLTKPVDYDVLVAKLYAYLPFAR